MDEKTFNEKVLPYTRNMFRLARSIVLNRELAEDITQEALVRLWRTRQDLHRIENMEAWCIKVVRNLSIDTLKKEGRYAANEENASVESNSTTPETALYGREVEAMLKKRISTLSHPQRTIIELRDFQEKSYEEIAAIMECSMSFVKVNLHRARQAVKKYIEEMQSYGLKGK